MSEQTIDIDTTQAAPALTITDDRHLCDVVYEIASKQLVINAAQANQQAKIEAAKKAFADGTAEFTAEIARLFAAVTDYATANKERLFPGKGKKQKKTYKVLSHELKFRSSTAAEAPADAVAVIRQMLQVVRDFDAPDGNWNGVPLVQVVETLKGLLRQPPEELNKDALLSLCASESPGSEALAQYLHLHGLRAKTTEGFKLVFSFTPEVETAN